MEVTQRGHLAWSPSQDHAIVEIIDTLVESNPDVLKRELFVIGLELFNEQFGTSRSFIAFKNHYYDLVRDRKNKVAQEEVQDVQEEVEQLILNDKEETADTIVSHIEGIVNSYEKIRDENKRLMEENESIKLQMTNKLGDYDALLRVIERARSIIIDEELGTAQKPRFKMESNGNLVATAK